MKNEYIIQQSLDRFTYVDVYSCCSLKFARKYYVILRDKYPRNIYRIVRWSYNV